MPIYYIDGDERRLATRDDMVAATKAEPIRQPFFTGPKPKWIRVTGPQNATGVKVGKVYRVFKWEKDAPWFKGDDGTRVWGRWPGRELQRANPGWEPASRPAPRKRKASKNGGSRA